MGKYSYKDKEFFNVEPLALKGGKPLTFDLFIYLPLNERIILIIKNTEAPDSPTLEKYKNKGLKFFYVRNSERSAFEEYLKEHNPEEFKRMEEVKIAEAEAAKVAGKNEETAITEVAAAANNDTVEVKEIAADAPVPVEDPAVPVMEIQPEAPPTPKEFTPEPPPEKVVEGLFATDEEKREKAIEQGKQMVKQIISEAPESVKQIMESEKAEHATKVAIYSTLFVMGMGQKDQWVLQDVIIASLLHDIGYILGDGDAIKMPLLQRTPEQNAEVQKHVTAGLEMLKDLDYSPNARTKLLLEQHHEKFNGSGYPNKMEAFNINEMAQVIHFADLVDTICHGWYDGTARSLQDALAVVAKIEKKTTFPEYFNPDVYRKIKKWLTDGAGKDYMEAATNVVEDTKSKMTA